MGCERLPRQTTLLVESVAVVGSREFSRPGLVRAFVASLPPGTRVVSGGARGVDWWAETAARARDDLPKPLVLPARWRRPDGSLDRSAGHRRNRLIVEACDVLYAFWDGSSPGTAGSIELARAVEKLGRVYVCP